MKNNIIKARHLDKVRYDIRGQIAHRAEELKYQGINILELNIGNPGLFGYTVPDTMNMAVIRNLDKAAGYCHSKGIFAAREAVVVESQSQGIANVHIDNVFLGNGVSELILMSMEALLNPGDEVLLPSPDYPLWSAAINKTGATPVYYSCKSENGWEPDPEEIETLVTKNTRALVMINPNNPTGAVYSRECLLKLVDICRRHELILYSDEIYDKITYDGAVHIPAASLSDDVITVTFGGLSKAYRACGYRCGWMFFTGPLKRAADYMAGIEILASMRLCSNVPGQMAVQTALGGFQSIFQLTADGGRLKKQRDLVVQRIAEIPQLKLVKPLGAMYAFPEFHEGAFPFKSDHEFIIRFLEEEHVLLVHGSGFNYNQSNAFRIVLLPYAEVLDDAMLRLKNFIGRYS